MHAIALLTDGLFPYEIGGMQKHAFNLARHLGRLGVEVDLYYAQLSNTPGEVHSLEDAPNVQLIPVPRTRPARFTGHYVWESYATSVSLCEALSRGREVEVVYAQGFAGWEAIRRRRRGVPLPPVAVNFHGFEMWQRPASLRARLEQYLLRPFVRWNVRHADATLLLGQTLGRVLRRAGLQPDALLLSPNGVDASWLTPLRPAHEGPRRFVFVGRYERRKGIEDLFRALTALGDEDAWGLDVIGPIPPEVRLDHPAIKYHGLVPEEPRIREILAGADILLCPSYAEGMPTVILEAMAAGLAVIATDVGAVSDLVDASTGWLVPPAHPVALVEALRDALRCPPERLLALQRAGQERVAAAYTWDRVAHTTRDGLATIAGTPWRAPAPPMGTDVSARTDTPRRVPTN